MPGKGTPSHDRRLVIPSMVDPMLLHACRFKKWNKTRKHAARATSRTTSKWGLCAVRNTILIYLTLRKLVVCMIPRRTNYPKLKRQWRNKSWKGGNNEGWSNERVNESKNALFLFSKKGLKNDMGRRLHGPIPDRTQQMPSKILTKVSTWCPLELHQGSNTPRDTELDCSVACISDGTGRFCAIHWML